MKADRVLAWKRLAGRFRLEGLRIEVGMWGVGFGFGL